MADINRDLDRYLSRRRGPKTIHLSFDRSDKKESWAGGFFNRKPPEAPEEDLNKEEQEQLAEMEDEIKEGEERLEAIHEYEEELEEEQEQKVSLYHQVLQFFRRKHQPEPEDIPEEELDVLDQYDDVKDDFRSLASIQLKWLELLPKRHKEAFRESDDYHEFREILERRGVAKRR